ncbi:MAG: hypothetical protein ACUVT7_09210 [Thermoplasmata archaeon]
MDPLDQKPTVVDPEEVALKMKLEYSRGVKDRTTRILEAVDELCWKLEKPDLDIDAFMREAADLISRHLAIASVAIAVRDPVDNLYRYKVVTGLEKEVAEAFKNLVYTKEQLENMPYPNHGISSHTKLYLSEEHPYTEGEELTYSRPALIGMKRRSATDSLEADYLCVYFYGQDGDMLGWMDISGTRLRKLPDATTIRWIELIASILGLALRLKR